MTTDIHAADTQHAIAWFALIVANVLIAPLLFLTPWYASPLLPEGVYRDNWFPFLNAIQFWSMAFYIWVFPVALVLSIVLGFMRATEKIARRILAVALAVGVIGLLECLLFVATANLFTGYEIFAVQMLSADVCCMAL